ncbi:MAG: hypothetical protein KAI43_14670 [Candidatus Aureabacteria bacterium]|nr:hypothetical protein [Candidatus Auribacterota bacterium]
MDNNIKKKAKYKKYGYLINLITGLYLIFKIRDIHDIDSIIYKIGIVGTFIFGLVVLCYGVIMFLETYRCEIVNDILENKQSSK